MAIQGIAPIQSSSSTPETSAIPHFHLIYMEYTDEVGGNQLRIESFFTHNDILERIKELFVKYGEDLDIEVIEGQRWCIEAPKKSLILGVSIPGSEKVIFDL